MAGELGLNEHHQSCIVNYLRFAKYKRLQHIKDIKSSFENVKESRLLEDTYTMEEVSELLEELCTVIQGEVDTEMIIASHTTVLLLHQMCSQAEQWHLRLQADISELENKDLLEKIRSFEESEIGGVTDKASAGKVSLEPLLDAQGTVKHLESEVQLLTEENNKLKARLKNVESKAFGILEEKSRLSENLIQAKSEIRDMKDQHVDDIEKDIELLQDQMSKVKIELEENKRKSSQTQQALEVDLTSTKHHLLDVQAQLELAEKELEKKFSQTAAYSNMKKMLSSKNDKIKELRSKLSKYEEIKDD